MSPGVKAPGNRAGPSAAMLAIDEMILGGGIDGGGALDMPADMSSGRFV